VPINILGTNTKTSGCNRAFLADDPNYSSSLYCNCILSRRFGQTFSTLGTLAGIILCFFTIAIAQHGTWPGTSAISDTDKILAFACSTQEGTPKNFHLEYREAASLKAIAKSNSRD